MTLRNILTGRTRAEMVGLFLALLDLIRNERVSFRQGQDEEGVGDEIVIELREDTTPAEPGAADGQDTSPQPAAAEQPAP